MITFLKTQIALIIGSLVDFGMTLFFVEILHSPYVTGNLTGNIFGAIAQFFLCRGWVFHAGEKGIRPQIVRFMAVYAGNLLLSAGGIYFFTNFLGIHYIISKLITSITLGLSYNYLMQKRFVFRTRRLLLLIGLIAFVHPVTFGQAARGNGDTIYWSADHPLKWDDFQAEPVVASPYAAITTAGIFYTLSYSKRSCKTRVYCYFLKSKSWSKTKDRAALLKHEQGHFDITELFARKLTGAFAAYRYNYATVSADLKGIFARINQEKTSMNERYDRETGLSVNASQQARWNRKFAKELAR